MDREEALKIVKKYADAYVRRCKQAANGDTMGGLYKAQADAEKASNTVKSEGWKTGR